MWPLIVFANYRGLHTVVEDLDRHTADGVEGLDMTTQQRLQVLVEDVAREQKREWPSTRLNSQTTRLVPGSSVKSITKRAKSTWAWTPGGVSKRTS